MLNKGWWMSVRLPCTEKKKCLKAIPERSIGKMEFTANRSNILRTYTFKKNRRRQEKYYRAIHTLSGFSKLFINEETILMNLILVTLDIRWMVREQYRQWVFNSATAYALYIWDMLADQYWDFWLKKLCGCGF